MNSVQRHLQEHGYLVVNQGYPSRQEPIEVLAATAIPQALAAMCQRYDCALRDSFNGRYFVASVFGSA